MSEEQILEPTDIFEPRKSNVSEPVIADEPDIAEDNRYSAISQEMDLAVHFGNDNSEETSLIDTSDVDIRINKIMRSVDIDVERYTSKERLQMNKESLDRINEHNRSKIRPKSIFSRIFKQLFE
jgi:hypothetical protein